ncbi:processed acidic surface protein [Metabacillus iocasae]|uniref:Processed acidic surface protein n=1 Tax=Priestia iocasae TaxID=2291674 RepID=A0ABS2QWW1_9BACI|nr:processed acidic surface protein [Metabacillus iocasae]MBM7703895.1 processed acidic surface protein [Metabacillus iocasae]
MKKIGAILLIFSLLTGLFPVASLAAQDPMFEQDLDVYLTEVSADRGFTVTKEHIESALSFYEDSLDSFQSVEELKDFLGEVILADLSNLSYIYEQYELDKESLTALLAENGESLEDYIYVDDLDLTVWFYTEGDMTEIDEDMLLELSEMFQDEFGLTEEELQRLEAHFMSIEEELMKPETLQRLEELANRMMSFEEFDVATELTSEQIAELMSVFNEMLSIFHLKVEFTLVQGQTETSISFTDLVSLEELQNASLKISFYNLQGEFLADMLLTGEMFDSEIITDTGKQIEESANVVEQSVTPTTKAPKTEKQKMVAEKKSEHQTVKGAKLPDTASNYLMNTLFGLLFVFVGFIVYRKVRQI